MNIKAKDHYSGGASVEIEYHVEFESGICDYGMCSTTDRASIPSLLVTNLAERAQRLNEDARVAGAVAESVADSDLDSAFEHASPESLDRIIGAIASDAYGLQADLEELSELLVGSAELNAQIDEAEKRLEASRPKPEPREYPTTEEMLGRMKAATEALAVADPEDMWIAMRSLERDARNAKEPAAPAEVSP